MDCKDVLKYTLVATAPLLLWFCALLILSTPTPFLVVASGSMNPGYKSGDLIIVRGVRYEKVRPDDVIVFRSPRVGDANLYIHRVVGLVSKEGHSYVRTKGDGSAYADSWLVSEEKVLGKVVASIPGLGIMRILAGRYFPHIVSVLSGLNVVYFVLSGRANAGVKSI